MKRYKIRWDVPRHKEAMHEKNQKMKENIVLQRLQNNFNYPNNYREEKNSAMK